MLQLFSYHIRLRVATALLSAALIAYQIAVIQLLSFVQWYHYANMVISIALLGFGAAGTLLAILQRYMLKHSMLLLPVLMICSGFCMAAAVWLSRTGSARFDSYLLFIERAQWLALFFNYLLFFLPFFFGALALGIIFIKYVADIGKVYFSNLLGSGIGAFIAIALAWYFVPASFPVVVACLAIVPGVALITHNNRWYIMPFAAGSFVLSVYLIVQPVDLSMSAYKSLSRTLNLPDARIIFQRPSPYGFVQVVSAEALRYAPGLSLAFAGEVPVKQAVFNNGDWFGPVVSWHPVDSPHILDYTTTALPYFIKKRNKVLVLYAATGSAVSHALSHDALDIDAVEPQRAIMDLLKYQLAKNNDSLFWRSQVTTHSTEPRTFLSKTNKKYDLIQLPLVGSFGGGAGLYAMQEEYLLTKEAFIRMWDLLEKDGMISITTWMDYPFRNPLKITATLAETLEHVGLPEYSSNLAAVRSWGTVTFILKKTPFIPNDTMQMRRFCNTYFFDPLLMPGLQQEERNFYNEINDTNFFSYTNKILSADKKDLYKTYGFHIQPATDDKPYFSQFLRWQSLPYLAAVFGQQSVSFLELGWLISAITFLQVSLLALILIIVPLLKTGRRGSNKGWIFIYFGGLGIGYMLLEIVLIQKFILFFGNPVYAAAMVIGCMMLASGAGSYTSALWQLNRFTMQRILLVIVSALLLYTLYLSPFLQSILSLPGWLKIFISFIAIALPAFFMGMPFPLGLRLLSTIEIQSVPWAWGINGCMSVISSAAAALLVAEAGFTIIMLLTALSYALCLLSVYLYRT